MKNNKKYIFFIILKLLRMFNKVSTNISTLIKYKQTIN